EAPPLQLVSLSTEPRAVKAGSRSETTACSARRVTAGAAGGAGDLRLAHLVRGALLGGSGALAGLDLLVLAVPVQPDLLRDRDGEAHLVHVQLAFQVVEPLDRARGALREVEVGRPLLGGLGGGHAGSHLGAPLGSPRCL